MKQVLNGSEIVLECLKEQGVDTVFGYPGGAILNIYDELYKQSGIDIILPRHEQALVHEADAYARTTGKVGVCLVTSGPGATNLVTGLATANYDSVPLVCFTGQVARNLIGNDAFQEVTTRSRRLILSGSPEASQNTVLPSATVRILDVSSRKPSISHAPDAQARFSSTFQRMKWPSSEELSIRILSISVATSLTPACISYS